MAPGRRLAAVMFTDTVGYTASTQTNEGRSLDQLRQQAELLRPVVAIHQGREIKSTGDGFLVEFDSALKAVQCAINLQRRLYERNSEGGLTPIRIRIGVHLGDVVQNGSDILGDAVNIAARIEPLAEPGGVCVSGAIYDQVRTKVPDKFAKLPPQAMKGLQSPIDVYRVVLPWSDGGNGGATGDSSPPDPNRLAVLPFANISPDPGDEYFADGLTEELIASLSLVPGLKVIARTSVIGYKKTEKPVSAIGKELGVGTIVEGSVRRAANRIRVTVQVIDVATEEHLWTSKYDDDLNDIFAVQSDIAAKVATSLPGSLEKARAPVPKLEKPAETEAYLAYLQGQALMWKTDESSLRQSVAFFEKSIRLDPAFARAYSGLSRAFRGLGSEGFMPWMDAIKHGRSAAERAAAIDPDLAEAHAVRAEFAFMADEPSDILNREVRRALELNPNLSEGHSILAAMAATFGVVESYIVQAEEAYHLDPLSPESIRRLGDAYFNAGQPDAAEAHWKKTAEQAPVFSYRGLVEYYLLKGDLEQAENCVRELERIGPSSDYAYVSRGYLAGVKGDRPSAMKVIAKLNDPSLEGNSRRQSSIGFIYYALGDLDRFFDCMNIAARDHTIQLGKIRLSPLFAAARKDPRFLELLSWYYFPDTSHK
ncbi:MAG: adenylate/guanylate cyclase domain-containing protein [Thermoplasmata archaeon]